MHEFSQAGIAHVVGGQGHDTRLYADMAGLECDSCTVVGVWQNGRVLYSVSAPLFDNMDQCGRHLARAGSQSQTDLQAFRPPAVMYTVIV